MFDRLYFIVLVLNATGLFSFLAPPLGVSIGQVSLVLLGMNLLYLVSKARDSTAILFRHGIEGWLFLLLLWPLATVLYAPSLEIRQVGLQLYYFTLFLGAIVYTVNNGLAAMRRVLSLSLAITIVGLLLSMSAPAYFTVVAEMAGATTFAGEVRASGFFLQPNSLALNLVFLFIGWFALWRPKGVLSEVTPILGILVAMLLTGSRTGALVVVIVIALTMMSWLRRGLANGRFLLKTSVLIVALLVGMIGMEYYVSQAEASGIQRDDLIGRVNMLLGLRLSDASRLSDDLSVHQRLGAQAVYWQLIKERPLLGHGLGSGTYYLKNGSMVLTAHSDAIASAMEYGILYPAAFVLLLVQLYRKRHRNDRSGVFRADSIGQFVVVSLFLFAIGSFADSRVFYVVLGMFSAAVWCPGLTGSCDGGTTRAAGGASRREMAA